MDNLLSGFLLFVLFAAVMLVISQRHLFLDTEDADCEICEYSKHTCLYCGDEISHEDDGICKDCEHSV